MKHLYHVTQFSPYSFIDLIRNVAEKFNPIKSFDINHFYHPLAPRTPDDPPDMAYWTCVFYKE